MWHTPPEWTAGLAHGRTGCRIGLSSALHVQGSERLLLLRAVLRLGLLLLLTRPT